MTITYPKGDSDLAAGSGASESSSHLTAIAIAVSIVFIVVATGLWFGFSQSQKAIEEIPAAVIPPKASPAVEQARVYEAIDGLQQCHKNTPDLSTAAARTKRQNCYYAVMTIFATSAVCDIISLDSASAALCLQAQARFIKDYPNGYPKDDVPQGTTNTNAPITIKTNTTTNTSGSTGSINKNTNTNGGGATSNTNTNGNTSSGNTNTNTVSAGNTNTSGNTNVAGNTNSNTNTNQTPPNTEPLCVNDPGQVVLLEHTNECQ